MPQKIKMVSVFESKSNHYKGKDLGEGMCVLVDPVPATSHQKWQVAQAIRYAVEDLVLDDE